MASHIVAYNDNSNYNYSMLLVDAVAERTLTDLPGKVLAAFDPDECRALVVSLGISASGTDSPTKGWHIRLSCFRTEINDSAHHREMV